MGYKHRRVWVHIGFHKTGTTFLQRYFLENRPWLLAKGILFPRTGLRFPRHPSKPDALSGHADLIPAPPGARADGLRQVLIDEAAEGDCEILLSSEVFSAPPNIGSAIAGLARICPSDDIRIIAYLRRQDHWLESFYKEVLGWPIRHEVRSLPEFYAQQAGAWLNYEMRLRPWADAFGRANVTVRSYDDAVAGPGVLADMLACISVAETPQMPQATERPVYPSLLPSLVDLVRALNGNENLGYSSRAAVMRALIEAERLDLDDGSLIADKLWCELASRYSPINSRLATDWMSGPTARFQFPPMRPPTALVRQRISSGIAEKLVRELSAVNSPGQSTADAR